MPVDDVGNFQAPTLTSGPTKTSVRTGSEILRGKSPTQKVVFYSKDYRPRDLGVNKLVSTTLFSLIKL